MAKHNRRGRFVRLAAALAVGGSAFQLSGCDPDVRSALLTGLESTTTTLSTTLIDVFFLTLEEDANATGNGNTTT
ncbi:MAG: hypothetical protein ABIG44_18945 [Planctomycetota bacterium]